MSDRPNIIVICSDTFRADYIGDAGPDYAADTPELDAFAGSGFTFENAIVSSFPTIPMRTDWFTGRFGHTRYPWQPLDPEAITLPGILADEGYTTQLIADTTHMIHAQFYSAFQHFHFERGHESDVPFSRMNDPIELVVEDRRKLRVDGGDPSRPVAADLHAHTNFRTRYENEAQSSVMTDIICHWIEDNHKGGPFLLWADLFDVHEPWYPPQYLLDHYQPGYTGPPMPHPNYHSADVYEPDELANLRARYAAQCTLLSKNMGRIFRLIEDTGLSENTIVVFLSDHGIYLGEHGLTGKSHIHGEIWDVFPFHREVSRFCFSMNVPESMRGDGSPGSRLPQLAQAPDLLPTLLEFAGINAPSESDIEGISLAPIIRGETNDSPRDYSVTAWTVAPQHQKELVFCRRPTITDNEWTLILFEEPQPEPPALYHTKSDPEHQHNVISENKDEAKRLHTALIDFLRTHDAPDSAIVRLSAANVGLV
jgi:arylsulfatase A-like enzyme